MSTLSVSTFATLAELEKVLLHETQYPLSKEDFTKFLVHERQEENIEFWSMAEAVLEKKGTHQKVLTLKEYTNETPEDLLDRMGKEYIAEGAPKQVNLSGDLRNELVADIQDNKLPNLEKPMKEVRFMMNEPFLRFMRKALTQNISEMEIRRRRIFAVFFNLLLILLGLLCTFVFIPLGLPRYAVFIILLPISGCAVFFVASAYFKV